MTSLFCHNGPQAKKEWNSTIMVVYFFFFFFEKNNGGLLGSCHIQSFFYFILFLLLLLFFLYVHVAQHDNFYFWFFWLNDLLGSCIWLDAMNQYDIIVIEKERIFVLFFKKGGYSYYNHSLPKFQTPNTKSKRLPFKGKVLHLKKQPVDS